MTNFMFMSFSLEFSSINFSNPQNLAARILLWLCGVRGGKCRSKCNGGMLKFFAAETVFLSEFMSV